MVAEAGYAIAEGADFDDAPARFATLLWRLRDTWGGP